MIADDSDKNTDKASTSEVDISYLTHIYENMESLPLQSRDKEHAGFQTDNSGILEDNKNHQSIAEEGKFNVKINTQTHKRTSIIDFFKLYNCKKSYTSYKFDSRNQ
jgi:hypothetical protein